MPRRELTVPVEAVTAREALSAVCTLQKRSQIDDTLFHRPDGVAARLRRQDTVTRLSCTHPGALADAPESIVLDPQACRSMLELLGFKAADRVRFSRETWRHCQYLVHLDRTETLGDFLTLEAEAGSVSHHAYRRTALKFLRQMGVSVLEPGLDSSEKPAYTAPIVQRRPTAFEAGRTT